MKKILSLVLVLMMLASCAAFAEDVSALTETLVQTAFTEGRNIAIDASINTNKELAALNGAALHIDAQLAGAPRLAVSVKNAEETITDFMIGSDESNLYLRAANIGDDIYAVSKDTIVETVLSLVDAFDIDIDDAIETIMSVVELTGAESIAEMTPDLSNLDLTPMFSAMSTIMANTVITDVEDYSMDQEAVSSTEPVEITDDAVEAEEASEEDDHNSISEPVAMSVAIVLDKDDLTVINNAIAATINANPEYAALYKVNAEEVYDTIQAVIDSLSESATFMLNLDADGCPVYASVSCSMDDEEGNASTFLMQAYKAVEGNTDTMTVECLISDDSTESFVPVFSVVAECTKAEDGADINASALVGNAVNGFGIELLYSGHAGTESASVELVSFADSVKTVTAAIKADGTLEINGADFAANGSVGIYIAPDEVEAPVIELALSVATTDPIYEDYSAAIVLDQMDPAVENQLQEDIAEVVDESTENYNELVEDAQEAVVNE